MTPVRVDADEHVDRLSGIADRVREIRVEVDVPEEAVALVSGHGGRIASERPEAVSDREELARLGLRQELFQAASTQSLAGPRLDRHRRNQKDHPSDLPKRCGTAPADPGCSKSIKAGPSGSNPCS